jgi:hypothetical protein
MNRTIYILMRWWWWLLYTISTSLVMHSWILIVLVHWNKSSWVHMFLYLDTLSWFRANQSLIFLMNTTCLAEKQQIPILWLLRFAICQQHFMTIEICHLSTTFYDYWDLPSVNNILWLLRFAICQQHFMTIEICHLSTTFSVDSVYFVWSTPSTIFNADLWSFVEYKYLTFRVHIKNLH